MPKIGFEKKTDENNKTETGKASCKRNGKNVSEQYGNSNNCGRAVRKW